VLNHALFARHGVEVVGAIVNKVDATAHPSLPEVLREGLARHGIELLGLIPYRPLLSNPTVSMLVEQMEGEVVAAAASSDGAIEHVAIGAMQPRHLVEQLGPGSLLIVPGDRSDVISATLAAVRASREGKDRRGLFGVGRRRGFGRQSNDPNRTELAGIVLTGGYRPRPRDLDAIRQAGIFAYLVAQDTYAAASEVHDLLVKTHPADRDKIALIKQLCAEHLDIDRIYDRFAEPPAVPLPPLPALPGIGAGREIVRGVRRGVSAGLRGLGRREAGSR
jgi:BioD-like phosphotransacetylase family protein